MLRKLFQSGGSNWFGLQLDMISFVLLLFILVFSLYFKDTISPESMGLLLSYSIKLMDYLHGIMNRLILLERLLTSVERCVGFTKVIQERPSNTEIDKENPNFPFSGSISFKNFSARYRPETNSNGTDINTTRRITFSRWRTMQDVSAEELMSSDDFKKMLQRNLEITNKEKQRRFDKKAKNSLV